MNPFLSVRRFELSQPYERIFHKMKEFTHMRNGNTLDELWLLEHDAVFTQGQAGKPQHILNAGDIPIIQSDRGGQVTYHGPGQLMIYALCDLKRLNFTIKEFVDRLEESVISLLKMYNISSQRQEGAPGIYVDNAKICSLGIRVRKGCAYHGMSLNVNMDLSPFNRINPCGFSKLKMTQISEFQSNIEIHSVITDFIPLLEESLQ